MSRRGKPGVRVLLVQTAFLGDIVMTTPLLREVRRALPSAEVCLLTTETGRLLLERRPELDEIWVYDKRWNVGGSMSYGALLKKLRGRRFDIAVAAQRSVRTGLIVRLSGAALRIGFAGAPGAWAYNRSVPWQADLHQIRRYLDLALPLGGEPWNADARPRLTPCAAARSSVAMLLRESAVDPSRPFLCVAPGSVRATKRWTESGFAAVVGAASARGLQPVVIGAPAEREMCEAVARASDVSPAVLAGKIDVGQLVALLSMASALVGNDSGPGHVAAAVGLPVVSVFGPTDPSRGYGPCGSAVRVAKLERLACRPCSSKGAARCPLGHFRCMRDLEPELVLARLDELLVERGRTDLAAARRAVAQA